MTYNSLIHMPAIVTVRGTHANLYSETCSARASRTPRSELQPRRRLGGGGTHNERDGRLPARFRPRRPRRWPLSVRMAQPAAVFERLRRLRAPLLSRCPGLNPVVSS
eukprot:6511999-Prymnesium_polylepis.1